MAKDHRRVHPEGQPSPLSIPPLVLMTFVENAFKHGISNHQASSIFIDLQASNGRIEFRCSNTLLPRKPAERPGIGIDNTRQRLEHLYGDQYKLNIATENNTYTVVLRLQSYY
ncbi:hypothetical protein [Paraflavitalea speifideaquila]|uniref:hypothetical protein n=1 Tax=Paraflavitalea speifideaquila TaxID=3076558 RepID=UPI0028E25E3D|nr:hypothetical protein [Paraflavitalea speifideiaquila]